MGAWRARGLQSERRVDELFGTMPDVSICEASTDPYPINFTVSWYLSRASFAAIAGDVEEEISGVGASDDDAEAGLPRCKAP